MKQNGDPNFFLERRSYRKRRFMDALRLIPFLGLMLWMLPLFWPLPEPGATGAIPMSTAVTYVFVIWVFLITATVLLTHVLRDRLSADLPADEDQGGT